MTPGERRQKDTDFQMGQHERRMMERARFGSPLAADLFDVGKAGLVAPKPVEQIDTAALSTDTEGGPTP